MRLTSNSTKAARPSPARTLRGLSLGADSTAALAARSRLQTRQNRPSAELAQVPGSGMASPSIRAVDMPHLSHVHFLRSAPMAAKDAMLRSFMRG